MNDDRPTWGEHLRSLGLDPADFSARSPTLLAIQQLQHDSDRAAGIVGSALVEEALFKCLKRSLTTSSKTKSARFDRMMSGEGPTATFSARTDLALLLGLISDDAHKELSTIRRIRNTFAHELAVNSFEHPAVRDLCRNLEFAGRYFERLEDGTHRLNMPRGHALATTSFGYAADYNPFDTLRTRYTFACTFFVNALGAIYLNGAPEPSPSF